MMNKKIILGFIAVMLISLLLSPVHAGESEDYEKKETVRVQCDPYGTVTKITVEDLLKLQDGKNSVVDYSLLTNIKNVEGDEEYTQKDDGTLIWENHGEDISYKGESHQPLPVNVKVTYYLNDKEITPEELVGQSGKVKIRFDYTNTTQQSVTVNNQKLNVHVPFLCTSALMLPTDKFSNVKVSNGKVLDNKDEIVVVGMAFPGIKEDLKLNDYEVTQDIDLPNYVEVTADVDNFELELTATLVSTIGLNDITELDDITDLTSHMKQLTHASSKLLAGAKQLNQGMALISQYLNQYFYGVQALDQGLQTIKGSLYTIKTQKQPLDEGLKTVNEKMTQLKALLKDISVSQDQKEAIDAISTLIKDSQTLSQTLSRYQNDLDKLDTFIKEAQEYKEKVEAYQISLKNDLNSIDLTEIENSATSQAQQKMKSIVNNSSLTDEEKKELLQQINHIQINGITDNASQHIQSAKETLNTMPTLDVPQFNSLDLSTLKTILADMDIQKENLLAYLSIFDEYTDIQDLINDLSTKLDNMISLTNGLQTLSQAIDQLYNASKTLSEASSTLVAHQKELKQGMTSLTDGMSSYVEGYQTFDQNGIQKLGNLAGNDLENIITRFQAIQKAESEYNNYSGIQEDCEGSVVFIYETDEIKK